MSRFCAAAACLRAHCFQVPQNKSYLANSFGNNAELNYMMYAFSEKTVNVEKQGILKNLCGLKTGL